MSRRLTYNKCYKAFVVICTYRIYLPISQLPCDKLDYIPIISQRQRNFIYTTSNNDVNAERLVKHIDVSKLNYTDDMAIAQQLHDLNNMPDFCHFGCGVNT